jgi:N6-adenosine-specific RNA methylase IME4
MSIDEIKALDVGALAADDCQLYLWTINKYLKEAFDKQLKK